MTEPRYKAVGFVNTALAVQSLCTAERFAAFVAALSPQAQALVRHPPHASDWLPLRLSREQVESACAQVFAGDPAGLREVGRRSQSLALRTVHKLFVRLLRPDHVIARASQVWRAYYEGNGSARVDNRSDRAIDLVLEGVVIPSPAYWQMMVGVCFAFGEATRVGALAVDIAGGGGDASHCRIRVTWG